MWGIIKKTFLFVFVTQTLIFSNPYVEELNNLKEEDENIYKAYILADENKIIAADNEYQVLPIASITKLMTAMVVLDNVSNLQELVTISEKAASIPYSIKLKKNEIYSVDQLLRMMLIASSNSSAESLKEYVGNDFIFQMNKKAYEIGAYTATYCSAHGLPPRYTDTCMDKASAYDIMLISKYALNNYPVILEIVSRKTDIVADHKLKNTNDLLGKNEYVFGTKTGFHNDAGYNISIFYNDNNVKLYEVILGSDSSKNRTKISEKIFEKFGGNE